ASTVAFAESMCDIRTIIDFPPDQHRINREFSSLRQSRRYGGDRWSGISRAPVGKKLRRCLRCFLIGNVEVQFDKVVFRRIDIRENSRQTVEDIPDLLIERSGITIIGDQLSRVGKSRVVDKNGRLAEAVAVPLYDGRRPGVLSNSVTSEGKDAEKG
ncbi:MAG: hypothetical protein ABGX07_07270, partial [Pirellulaceae bacterium]